MFLFLKAVFFQPNLQTLGAHKHSYVLLHFLWKLSMHSSSVRNTGLESRLEWVCPSQSVLSSRRVLPPAPSQTIMQAIGSSVPRIWCLSPWAVVFLSISSALLTGRGAEEGARTLGRGERDRLYSRLGKGSYQGPEARLGWNVWNNAEAVTWDWAGKQQREVRGQLLWGDLSTRLGRLDGAGGNGEAEKKQMARTR